MDRDAPAKMTQAENNTILKCQVIGRDDIPEHRFIITVDLATATFATLTRLVLDKVGPGFQVYCGDVRIDNTGNETKTLLRTVLPNGHEHLIRCLFNLEANGTREHLVAAATAALKGAAVAPGLVTAAVQAAGFGTGGIVAGTPAATFMSSYGGSVAAGSVCSVLQSVGAVGLGYFGTLLSAGAGAVLVGGCAWLYLNRRDSKRA